MKKAIVLIALACALISCTKTQLTEDQSQGKAMIRIESVDSDGNLDYSNVVTVYVPNK